MHPLVSDLDVGGMSLLLLQVLLLTAAGLADFLGGNVEREGAIRKIAVFENRIVSSAEGGETSWCKRHRGRREVSKDEQTVNRGATRLNLRGKLNEPCLLRQANWWREHNLKATLN